MLGSIRLVRVTLTFLVLAGGPGVGLCPAAPAGPHDAAGGPAAKTSAASRPQDGRLDVSEFFAQPGDDPPRPFVPLRPSTLDDRRRLEAVRLYIAGRALEDRRAWTDAVSLLQEALKLEPDSIAIARRLSRI